MALVFDITTENELFAKGKRARPKNPYQLCSTELEMQLLYQTQLNYFRRAKKHFNSPPLSAVKQAFLLERLPPFAEANPWAKDIVDVICSKVGSYKESDDIFSTLYCAPVDKNVYKWDNKIGLGALAREFNSLNKKAKRQDVVLVKQQSLDEILALKLANAEKKGEVITIL